MSSPFQNKMKRQQRRNERLMRKAARISARQSGESMGGIDYELPKVQKILGKTNKVETVSYNDVDPRLEEQGIRYDSGINYGSPLNGAYESGVDSAVYVSNAPAFSKLQNQINASTKEAIYGLAENKKYEDFMSSGTGKDMSKKGVESRLFETPKGFGKKEPKPYDIEDINVYDDEQDGL